MIGVRGKGYRIYTSLLDFFSGLELLANEGAISYSIIDDARNLAGGQCPTYCIYFAWG
jgi:hypothetical protein